MEEINNTNKKFVKVRCHKCENQQVIFGRASTEIKCLKCGEVLAVPRGGKAAIKAEILELV